MKLKYTLRKDIPSGTAIEINDFYYCFDIEILLLTKKEEIFWNGLPNKSDVLRTWFQMDLVANRELRQRLLGAKLNESVVFDMGDEIDQLPDDKFKETCKFMGTIKFEPVTTPTLIKI